MKILFVQHLSFINGSGGTEKICCFLANHFSSVGYSVEIATNENIEGKPMFPLNENIKITNIFNPYTPQKRTIPFHNYHGKNLFLWIKYKIQKKKAKFYNNKIYAETGGKDELYKYNLSQRSKDWKNYIEKVNPNLIITLSIGSLLEITYQNSFNIPIINSTNGRPDHDYTDVLWYRSPLEMKLLKECYQYLSGNQILFESYKNFMPETFNGLQIVIPNPVPNTNNVSIINHSKKKDRYRIINVASLVLSHKQQHLSINAFSKIANQFPNWDLHFWGIGRDHDTISKMIKDKGLSDRIFLCGFTNDPLKELISSDIFIFPSRHEGLPIAMVEAMSVGLPCLGLESCEGVNELIIHNKTGFLAKDDNELSKYLQKLIEDPSLRQEFGELANENTKGYENDTIFHKWHSFIKLFERN